MNASGEQVGEGGPHIELNIGQEEDGGEGGGCAQDADSRVGALDPLIKLREQAARNEGAHKDANDLTQAWTHPYQSSIGSSQSWLEASLQQDHNNKSRWQHRTTGLGLLLVHYLPLKYTKKMTTPLPASPADDMQNQARLRWHS